LICHVIGERTRIDLADLQRGRGKGLQPVAADSFREEKSDQGPFKEEREGGR